MSSQPSERSKGKVGVPLIFETGQKGRANRYLESGQPLENYLPKSVLRNELPLPDNSEMDVVRHYTRLSHRTFGIDLGFYPLGSCTMKYNPRVNDAIVARREFAELHPFAPDELAQGALQVMYELERSLSSLFGMAAFSLNPSAGAHAELGALLIAKKYFKERGEAQRDKVIVPDTAHGTNPASAAMCGFKVISLPSNAARTRQRGGDSQGPRCRHGGLHDDQSQYARAV